MSRDLYTQAKSAYYAGEPIMSDVEFDALESALAAQDASIARAIGQPSGDWQLR